jgi:antitoxin (DNA-binding transcriptional repressor) of toxin-antitoxin stability system
VCRAGIIQLGVVAGNEIIITTRGRPVATLGPIVHKQRRWLPRADLIARLGITQADPALRSELARIVDDTTDDLGPIV